MDQRLNRALSKAAPEILATKLSDTGGEKKTMARLKRQPAGRTMEKVDGDKVRPARFKAKSNSSVSRLSRTRFLAMPKRLVTPFKNKTTQPFVTGSAAKSHNIGIRLQQLDKSKRTFHEPSTLVVKRTKSTFSQQKQKNTGYKGWIEPQEEKVDFKKKVKEMFVGLHNEFSALIDTQANLKKADVGDNEIRFRLSEVERQLEEKEVQIHVAVKLYDENQKLKEEVAWLRKNIRPGRRKRPYHPKCSTDLTPVITYKDPKKEVTVD